MKVNEEVRSTKKDISTENVNLVMHQNNNKDEVLETEESMHGVLVLSNLNESNLNRSYNIVAIKAKDTSNMINDNDKIEDVKREFRDESSTTTTQATAVTKVNRRKYTRTSLLPTNHTRPTAYRGRVRYSPSSIRTAVLEEVDDPYLENDQKLGVTRKYSTTRRPTTSQASSTTSRSKEEELEIMEVSVAKQSSTEKNIFWKARNIVAINNYMRKFSPNLSVMSTIAKSTKAVTKSPEISVITTTTKAIPTKVIYSRPTKLPSLIINIPNDASPIFYTDNRNYQLSNGDFEDSTLPETTTLKTVEEQESYIENITKKEEEISSTTQSTTILPSLIDSTLQTKSFRKNYTTIPRRSESSTKSSSRIDISSTISSFLSNVSSKKQKHVTANNYVSSSTVVSMSTETLPTTTPMNVFRKEEAKTSVPLNVEAVVPPSPKSFTTTTTTIQLHTLYEAISTTSKPEINDVFVEEQKANVTTYALGAAFFLPLIVIVLLVIRQYVHKNERKSDDIENYSNDVQPISPVVTLDHGEDSSCFEGDDSIVSEGDFNRSKLKFKSLLGEGNFGQVWKAEIEDHSDHIGTIKIVAVKTERANNGQGGLKAEWQIMRKLLPAHPNVVTLLGACVSKEPHMLIMSYEMRGKLLSLLRTARGVMNNGTLYHRPHNRETSMPLSPRRLTGFAHDIAKGMEYIAEKGVSAKITSQNLKF